MSKLLLLLIIISSMTASLHAQDSWSLTSGPCKPENTRTLAVAGNGDLIAVTSKGIYTSSDMGKSWDVVEKGQILSARTTGITTRDSLVLIIGDFVVDNSESFMAYFSKDNGRSWQHNRIGNIIGYYDSTRAIIDTKGRMYFCAGQNLFFSSDTCQTFRQFDNSRPEFITALACDSNNTIYVGYASGLIYTTDEGKTWDTTETDRPIGSIAVTSGNRVITATDFGLRIRESLSMPWQTLTNIMPGITYCLTAWEDDIYAGTSYGVHKFDFKTKDWISAGLNENGILALAVGDNGRMIAGAGKDGLFSSSDYGSDWKDVNSGIFNQRVTTITIDNANKIYALSPNVDIYMTTDQGGKWTALGMKERYPIAVVCSNDTAFVTTFDGFTFYFTGEIDYSNYVKNWYPIVNLIKRGSRIYGYTSSQILRLNMTTANWENPVMYLDNNKTTKSITVDDFENYYVIALETGELRQYDKTGKKTIIFNSGINAFFPAENGAYYALKDGRDFLISYNNTTDWKTLPVNLGQGETGDKIFAYYDSKLNKNVIIITAIPEMQYNKRILLRSTDEGKTWTDYTAGINPTVIFSMMYDGSNTLYAGTGDGVYRADHVTAVKESNPAGKDIINIYPNPAKDFFYVERGRGLGEPLSISIFNTLGGLVYKKEDVTGNVKIDCSGFVPGLYFIKANGIYEQWFDKIIIE